MKPTIRIFWLALAAALALSLGGLTNGLAAPLMLSTATVRPSDTRWPSRTPTVSRTPTITQTPTITRTPTVTRTPSNTPTPSKTPLGALPAPTLLSPTQDELTDNIRPRMDWDDVPGATAYSITVSRYSSFAYPLVSATVKVSEYTPTIDLPRNAALYWRVRAVSPTLGTWAVGKFSLPNPPYAAALVTPYSNALLTTYTPTLDWNAPYFPAGAIFAFYQLQVDDNADFSSPLVEAQETDKTRHLYNIATPLAANTTYYWRVRTASAEGMAFSNWSLVRSFRTALPAPELLSPAYLEVPNHPRPRFDWGDVPNATAYGLMASIYPNFASPFLSVSVTTSEYLPTTDLPRNKVIYWRVRAQGTNTSAWASNQFTTPNVPYPTYIYSPTNGALVGPNPTLDWSTASLPTGAVFGYYQIQVDDNADFSSPLYTYTEGDISRSYFISSQAYSLQSGTTYYWRVRAANTTNQFNTWAIGSFRTTGATPTPGPSATPTTIPGNIIVTPAIRQLYMIDRTTGWALANDHLLRTTDGGKTWVDGRIPTDGILGYATRAFFYDTQIAWLFNSGLYHTTNGTQTWVMRETPFGGGILHFSDPANGFALVSLGSGAGREAIAIYQTSDSGETWARRFVNDPVTPGASDDIPLGGRKTGIYFRNSQNGWVVGSRPEQGYTPIYITNDAGRNWTHQQLSLPAGFTTAFAMMRTPIFFNQYEGVLPVALFNNADDRTIFLYTTRNGGVSWTRASGSYPLGWANLTDFVSYKDGITWANGTFGLTRNAGASWSPITPNITFPGEVTWLDFATITTGWVIVTDEESNSFIYKTDDSGWTWTLVSSNIPQPTETPTPAGSPFPSPTPTVTPTAPATLPPYAVVEVIANDVLNIRSAAGVTNPVVGTLPYDAKNVIRTGPVQIVSGATWVEVQNPAGGAGWVNFYYLGEQVASEPFCADSRVTNLYQQVRAAINASDGAALAALTSPKHGLYISYWHNYSHWYTQAQVANLFSDTTSKDWGTGPSGTPTTGTFSGVVQPSLNQLLNSAYELYCNDPKAASMFYEPWPSAWTNYNYYSLFKPGTPGIDLDYLQWSAAIDYIDGRPYLVALQRTVWEP